MKIKLFIFCEKYQDFNSFKKCSPYTILQTSLSIYNSKTVRTREINISNC